MKYEKQFSVRSDQLTEQKEAVNRQRTPILICHIGIIVVIIIIVVYHQHPRNGDYKGPENPYSSL